MNLFLFLWLLSAKRESPVFTFPPPSTQKPVPVPPPGAVTPPSTSVPAPAPAPGAPPAPPTTVRRGHGVAPGTHPGPPWKRYNPLNPAIISRAQGVLRSGNLRVIEADPTRPGKRALYQREYDPTTNHTRVTAWSEGAI